MYEDNYLHVSNIEDTLIVSSNSHTERLFKLLTQNLFLAGTIKKTNQYVSFKDIEVISNQLDISKVCKVKLDKLFQERLGYSEGIRGYCKAEKHFSYNRRVHTLSFDKKI